MKALTFALAGILFGATPVLAEAAPANAGDSARIVEPVRNIARGDIISADDLATKTVPNGNLFSGVADSVDQLAGKQARRFLRLGQPVRIDDVRAQILVTKGSTVTMTFHAPGITLTAVGKAMSEDGRGEMVTVLNPVSYRQITATVTGPGTVAAGGEDNTISPDPVPAQLATRN